MWVFPCCFAVEKTAAEDWPAKLISRSMLPVDQFQPYESSGLLADMLS